MATYPTVAPGNSLVAIQQKVRRLTQKPSEAQLTTDDLNNYINTFVMYDFPEHIRTFQLKQPFSFWCNPLQDTYQTDIQSFGGATNASSQSLYNFQNLYLNIHQPVYVAGYQVFFTQSREEFYNSYPITNYIQSIGVTGDGTTTFFTGFVQFGGTNNNSFNGIGNQQMALLKRNVLFDSVDINGNGLSLIDVPVLDATTGIETIWGNLYIPGQQPTNPSAPPVGYPIQPPKTNAPYFTSTVCNVNATNCVNPFNYINYQTGQFAISFPVAPAVGQTINSQSVPVIPARPFAMLYYNNTFTIRPVPDQPYAVNFEVDARPTQLFQQNSVPQLEELWQYIAYGAAKKIFEDAQNLESVQAILPEFDQQERMCLRRTLVQIANQRTATIYSATGTNNGGINDGWGFGGTL